MKEITGNIWSYHRKECCIVVTTNGIVKDNGEAVMGRGIALEAKSKFPALPRRLGKQIKVHGNRVFLFADFHIITFPTKHSWRDNKSDIGLIERGARQLASLSNCGLVAPPVYLVRPGCGNGGLDWEIVKPILGKHLDDRFFVIAQGGE